jgi:hypothetical protein
MPRYFFDLYNGHGDVADSEGREFPDAEAARDAAIEDIRSILSDEVKSGSLDLDGQVVVRDAEKSQVMRVRFDDAIQLRRSK